MMNIKEAYIWMHCWQEEFGESFLEYFGDTNSINLSNFALWLNYNNYLSDVKLAEYQKALFENRYNRPELSNILMGEEPYSVLVFFDDEWSSPLDNAWGINFVECKAFEILATYLCQTKHGEQYIKQFCFEGKNWSTEENKSEIAKQMQQAIGKWIPKGADSIERVSAMQVHELNKTYGPGQTMVIAGVLLRRDSLERLIQGIPDTTRVDNERWVTKLRLKIDSGATKCHCINNHKDLNNRIHENNITIYLTSDVAIELINIKDKAAYLMKVLEGERDEE